MHVEQEREWLWILQMEQSLVSTVSVETEKKWSGFLPAGSALKVPRTYPSDQAVVPEAT